MTKKVTRREFTGSRVGCCLLSLIFLPFGIFYYIIKLKTTVEDVDIN